MNEDDEELKVVFARFGMAAYNAQCVEAEIKNIFLALVRANNTTLSADFLERCGDTLDKQTLGILIRDIRNVVSFDDRGAQSLKTALANRNSLMHGFFERHAIDLLIHEGRDVCIQELESYIESFIIADTIAKCITGALCKPLGLTEEFLRAELEKLKCNRQSTLASKS